MKPHEPGDVVLGYRVERALGRGGSSTTYEATRESTGERVALKRLAVAHASDWKQVDLFEREARVLARLAHPSVPRYIAHFTADGPDGPALYIAEELVTGRSLAELAPRGHPMSEVDVRALAIKMLGVLEYLGSQAPPVIHRDIKPENVLRRDDGTIVLVDFGAVRSEVSKSGRGSTTVGTYGYMAPEQLHGVAIPATDIYGLASTMVFLLTGRSPVDLPRRKLRIDIRAHAKVTPSFARWLDRALEPASEDRFPSAGAALAALQRVGTGLDEPAPTRQVRAFPRLAAALAAALVVTGGALAVTLARRPAAPAVIATSVAPAAPTAQPNPFDVRRSPRLGERPPAPVSTIDAPRDDRMIAGLASERGLWPPGYGPHPRPATAADPPPKHHHCTPNARYTILEDGNDKWGSATGRVRDNKTGLTWLQNPLKGGNWRDAADLCIEMGDGFRLPTEAEVDGISGKDADICAWPSGFVTWTTTPKMYTASTGQHVPDYSGVGQLCVK